MTLTRLRQEQLPEAQQRMVQLHRQQVVNAAKVACPPWETSVAAHVMLAQPVLTSLQFQVQQHEALRSRGVTCCDALLARLDAVQHYPVQSACVLTEPIHLLSGPRKHAQVSVALPLKGSCEWKLVG